MRLVPALSFVALAVLLSACQTLSPEERRALDDKTCLSYGFRKGTDSFATCLMNLELDRRADYRSFRDQQTRDFWGPSVIVERPIIIRR